jgi:anti-anti-sigma regulatory factor
LNTTDDLEFPIQGVPKLFFLVLDLAAVHHVDAMGLHFLEDLIFSTRAKGIQLILTNPNHKVRMILCYPQRNDPVLPAAK